MEIEQFKFNGQEMRTLVEESNSVLFLASDVCRILGYQNGRKAVSDHCKLDGVTKRYIIDSMGRNQEATFLSEPNMYRLVMKSNKPEAEPFERWVMEEVLPSIRRKGSYQKTSGELSRKDLALMVVQAEEEKEQALLRLTEANQQIESDKPKVIFADAVSVSDNSLLIGEVAKILKQKGVNIGQNRLFEWMRSNGYLIKRSATDFNMPTQRAMDMKLFEIKETAITHSNGKVNIAKTPRVTGIGQIHFINKFISSR
jgi:anti-repressor protein